MRADLNNNDHQTLTQSKGSNLVEQEQDGKSIMNKLRKAKNKTKRRTKNLLGVSSTPQSPENSSDEDSEDAALHNISRDPAFHPSHVEKRLGISHAKQGGPIKRATVALDVAASAVAHPRKTIKGKAKRKAAGEISGHAQVPTAAQDADVVFLEYERELERSKSSESAHSGASHEEVDHELYEKKSKLLEQQRDSMRAAWITTRTKRVRVVPKKQLTFPTRTEFTERDDAAGKEQTHWFEWLGHLCLYYTQDFATQYVDDFDDLPFDMDELRTHAERLVIASGPWQAYFMDLRSLYRWEDPKRTGKYCAVYLSFWYMNHVATYFWAYLIIKILYNRYHPSSFDHLREAARRSVNHETAAFQLGEMIDRHGRDEWIDPFLEQVGPYAQIQINDLANLLEVIYNFYTWRSPRKTLATLFFLFSAFLVALLADKNFCLRIFWFVAGGTFFGCWPVASLYPRYRLLVSPFKWMLWDIPTHAEWSFMYLRRQAQETREALIGRRVKGMWEKEERASERRGMGEENGVKDGYEGHLEMPAPEILVDGQRAHYDHHHHPGHHAHKPREHRSSTSSSLSSSSSSSSSFSSAPSFQSAYSGTGALADEDLLTFKCTRSGTRGRLIITPHGIRFVRRMLPKELWRVEWPQFVEMWKLGGGKIRKITGGPTGSKSKGMLCVKTLSSSDGEEAGDGVQVKVVGGVGDEVVADIRKAEDGDGGREAGGGTEDVHLGDAKAAFAVGDAQVKRGGKGGVGWGKRAETVYYLQVKERDEAFNCILGFSGLQWQSLQAEKEKEKEMMKEVG